MRVVLPVTECFSDLCNTFLPEVVTWHVRYTSCFIKSGFGMLKKSMLGYCKETVNLVIVIMLN